MWDRPNQKSMVRTGMICNQVVSGGRRRADLLGSAGLKQAR